MSLAIIPKESWTYLKSPIRCFGLAALLICINLYSALVSVKPYPLTIYIVLLLASLIIAALFRSPRWVAYTILLGALVVQLFAFVHIVANGTQDKLSNRDTAVEVTAQALLHGENAWNADAGTEISTGPASILLAIPFVKIFGAINWLSFGFWLSFFLILLYCDIRYRNNTWPIMVMVFIMGLFGFDHTLFWSLEELYYPIIYIALMYYLFVRKRVWGVGALWALSILTRPSYAFLAIGFLFWYFFNTPFSKREFTRMGLSFLLTFLVVLLPFVIIGGNDILLRNPLGLAFKFSGGGWPETNFIFHYLNHLGEQIGVKGMRWAKLFFSLSFMFLLSWRLRLMKIRHPFWHITAGALIAHTLVWLPAHMPYDYILIFVLPAMLAISMTRSQRMAY